MAHTWDPDRYLAYADERARPFVDLISRIGATDPRVVVDLGCGPGNLTALLTQRWPTAQVRGIDSSPAMIDAARRDVPAQPHLEFEVGDLRDARDAEDAVDVLVTNATLQWVPGHLDLVGDLVARLAPGGWFAMQVPANFDEPSHTIRTELAARPDYADHLRSVAVPSSHEPLDYYEVLSGLGLRVEVWETTYLHVLHGPDPVFTWVSGTGARPTLQALPADLRARFEAEFKAELAHAYPARDDGAVLLPFRRVFAVAHLAA